MTTYKISFLPPRKASSLQTKRSTQINISSNIYRKNSKTKRDNVELPATAGLKTVRKITFSQRKNKSIERNIEKLAALQLFDKRFGGKKQSQSLDIKQRLGTKFPTARAYTQKESEKFEFAGYSKSPQKRSFQKAVHTQQLHRKTNHQPTFQLFQPMASEDCIHKYKNKLTVYEKQQMKEYDMIYYLGQRRLQLPREIQNFDDQQGDIHFIEKDQIAYRYEIRSRLGKGSFGEVFRAFDHKEKCIVALKIIKNKPKYNTQAMVEIKILKYIREHDSKKCSNAVQIKDSFVFRQHVVHREYIQCICFELLQYNLYEFIKMHDFQGFPLDLIRRFSIQILQCLLFLRKHSIVHCDLKPQNILLKQENKSGIKIIDFGSGCFQQERIYTYIQSRFYRAPQIILGIAYTTAIDMWSLGCIVCELFLGPPLFPGENQTEQIALFMELLGIPPQSLLQRSSRKKRFFNEGTSEPKPFLTKNGKPKKYGIKTVELVLKTKDRDFISFVKGCLEWQPQKRMTPAQGLMHPWILNGLPQDIRAQHLSQMRLEMPDVFT